MKILSTSGLMLTLGLLMSGCASSKQDNQRVEAIQRIEALRNDPAWPAIRTAAKLEILKRESYGR